MFPWNSSTNSLQLSLREVKTLANDNVDGWHDFWYLTGGKVLPRQLEQWTDFPDIFPHTKFFSQKGNSTAVVFFDEKTISDCWWCEWPCVSVGFIFIAHYITRATSRKKRKKNNEMKMKWEFITAKSRAREFCCTIFSYDVTRTAALGCMLECKQKNVWIDCRASERISTSLTFFSDRRNSSRDFD